MGTSLVKYLNIIIAIIQISRPINVIITMATIAVICWIINYDINNIHQIIFASIAGGLVLAGANAINDYYDFEIDKINKPKRPLQKGIIKKQYAIFLWIIFSAVAIILNLFINLFALILVVATIVLLYLYSAKLKKTFVLGNLVVAFITGLTFVYGGIVSDSINKVIVPAIFAFIINLAREIIKDIEDIEGDKKYGSNTLPIKYGKEVSAKIAISILLILIFVTIVVIMLNIYSNVFLFIIVSFNFITVYIITLLLRPNQNNIAKSSMLLKINIVIGLIAILTGSL